MPSFISGLNLFDGGKQVRRYRLISCEVAYRECCLAVAVSPNVIDLHFLTQGLHDLQSKSMCERVQQAVDETPAGRYEAILLGYGLCNNGLVGVTARHTPLVLPRAHDCITLFLGSKEKYAEQFAQNSGTYYLTTGWVERDHENLENTHEREDNIMHKMGLDKSYEEYAALYGEEAAKMIFATIGGMQHYREIGYIDMGVAPLAEEHVQTKASAEAQRRGWTFNPRRGRMDLFLELTRGDWDESKFLIVPPGHRIEQSYDESIVKAAPAA